MLKVTNFVDFKATAITFTPRLVTLTPFCNPHPFFSQVFLHLSEVLIRDVARHGLGAFKPPPTSKNIALQNEMKPISPFWLGFNFFTYSILYLTG